MLPRHGTKPVEDLDVNGHRALPLPCVDEQEFITTPELACVLKVLVIGPTEKIAPNKGLFFCA